MERKRGQKKKRGKKRKEKKKAKERPTASEDTKDAGSNHEKDKTYKD